MNDGYGLRWREVAKRTDEIVVKEKFFKTDKERERFVEKLSERDGFIEVVAWCAPLH